MYLFMLDRIKPEKPDDYFLRLSRRKEKGVCFCRLNAYNKAIHDFLLKYYEAARLNGVIIEGRLNNPDQKNLAYYTEIMGTDFKMDPGFITNSLRKWLPRMTPGARMNVSKAMYDTLDGLRKVGKTDHVLKNAYIKFMCWLYYRFERIVNRLGEDDLPKILYEGSISNYEFLLMSLLSTAGCDILLLQYAGDAEYLKLDPGSERSMELKLPDMTAFPPGFSLKNIQEEIRRKGERDRLYGGSIRFEPCTNAWMTGNLLEDLRTDTRMRGEDKHFFYNSFCRMMGAEDKLTYENDLFQLQLSLKNSGRKILIADNNIEPPSVEEINAIRRKNYKEADQMILDLATNIRYAKAAEIQKMAIKAFVELMEEESKKSPANLNRLTNKAVYILCWIRRYFDSLFGDWNIPQVSCFFHMGACTNEAEAIFMRLLARLPVDVIIFQPSLSENCLVSDPLLYEVHHSESLNVSRFPRENRGLQAGTAAYHAERELDTIMYKDSGIYRDRQFIKANTLTLRTMYEEIPILWDQELKYRPNFSSVDELVNLPVIFAKVSGVKNGNLKEYWTGIKRLMTENTTVIKKVPSLSPASPNPIRSCAAEFYKNGKLQRERIKSHKAYSYGFLRDAMQEYLLDKLSFILSEGLIKGIGKNGTEYTVISVALNLDKTILRLIQNFDFTRKNPKLIYIITGEEMLSLEDTIYATFLHLVGFDILFFVPTGYQSAERYMDKSTLEEHQIGEYVYDLQIPDFDQVQIPRQSWLDRLFNPR